MNLRGIYAEPFFYLLFEHLLSSSRFMTKKKWTRITTHEFFHNVAVWKTLFMLKAQEYSSFQCWQYWIQWRNVRSCPIEINWIKPERSAVRELTLTNAYKRIFFFKLFIILLNSLWKEELISCVLWSGLDNLPSSSINIEEDLWLISWLRKVISQSEAKCDHKHLFSLSNLMYLMNIHTKPNQQHRISH